MGKTASLHEPIGHKGGGHDLLGGRQANADEHAIGQAKLPYRRGHGQEPSAKTEHGDTKAQQVPRPKTIDQHTHHDLEKAGDNAREQGDSGQGGARPAELLRQRYHRHPERHACAG